MELKLFDYRIGLIINTFLLGFLNAIGVVHLGKQSLDVVGHDAHEVVDFVEDFYAHHGVDVLADRVEDNLEFFVETIVAS